MIKLATLLREIGENTAEAYTARKVEIKEDRTKYSFETDSGLTYRVVIAKTIQDLDSEGNLNNEVAYDVSFGVVNFVDKEDYDAEVNDPKNLFRVMATVINVTKEEITEDETVNGKKVVAIYITPSKTKKDKNTGEITYDPSDYRRYKLYRALIEKNAPLGSTVEEVGSQLVINLPEERPLEWKKDEQNPQ